MPVEGNTQPYGLLHGGASVVLAETLGSFGSVLHAGPGRVAVGIDINATHHRAARSGVVTGDGDAAAPGLDHGVLAGRRSPTSRAGRSARRGSPACSATRHPAPDGACRRTSSQSLTRATAARTRRSERRRASRLSVDARRARRREPPAQDADRRRPPDDDRAEAEPGVEPLGLAHLRQHAGDDVLGADLVGERDGRGQQRLADARGGGSRRCTCR